MAIHQPNFCPRLKVLLKIAQADSWIALDDVQFTRRDFQHRARYRSRNSAELKWLTLPVSLKNGQRTLINEVVIAEPDKAVDLASRTIWHTYRKSAEWSNIDAYWARTISHVASGRLVDITMASMTAALEMIGAPRQLLVASTLIDRDQPIRSASERLAILAVRSGSDTYISGTGGQGYIQRTFFDQHHIDVVRQAESGPVFGPARNLGFIQAVADLGLEEVRSVIVNGIAAGPERETQISGY